MRKPDLNDLDKVLAGVDNRTLYLVGALGIGSLLGYFAYLNFLSMMPKEEQDRIKGKVEAQIGGASSPYWEKFIDEATGQEGIKRKGKKTGWESGLDPTGYKGGTN